MAGSAKTNTDLKSPALRAFIALPYSQGGVGKYGLESDMRLLNSANLFMMKKGEHLGTGAGVGCGKKKNT